MWPTGLLFKFLTKTVSFCFADNQNYGGRDDSYHSSGYDDQFREGGGDRYSKQDSKHEPE
uniref:Uncharacterized protein n=1 Tax=Caenorhabditis japonica TaxID=281687 RepID=A0A8R1J400_CAEJA